MYVLYMMYVFLCNIFFIFILYYLKPRCIHVVTNVVYMCTTTTYHIHVCMYYMYTPVRDRCMLHVYYYPVPCTVPYIFFNSFGVLFSQFMSHNNFVCCFFFVSWHERHIVSLRSVFVVQWTAFLGGRLNQGTKELCDGSVHLRETKPSLCHRHRVVL